MNFSNRIWQPTNFYGNWEIGEGTSIGAFCDIGGKIGKDCKIQTHVSIPPGVTIKDNVFIGPGVRFCNDPKMDGRLRETLVKSGAKIGAGAIIGAALIIGKNSVIGMGSVVTHDVGDNEVWYGNPARKIK